MATMNSALGGPAGYGENVFSSATKFSGDNDDGTVQIDVTSVFSGGMDFFGSNYTEIYINSNGAITFGSAIGSIDTNGLNDFSMPALAPFYSDIDITQSGEIYWDVDPANGKITVTWDGVKSFDGGGGLNSFQVVLTDLGGGDFGVEYIYEDIQWADTSGDPAATGFTDGSAIFYDLEGSNSGAALYNYESNDFDNGDPAGTWSFSTSGGTPDVLGVNGTSDADSMGLGYTDADGDQITAGDDTIFGGDGNDTIDAYDGDDSVDAGDGDDVIWAGYGNDTYEGGAGTDTYQIDGSEVDGIGFDVDLDAGSDQWNTLSGIENVEGGSANDTLTGDSNDNVLSGNGGDDYISGGDGDDSLHGGDGNDTISDTDSNSSRDTIDGGAGNDSINAGGLDTVYGGAGDDTINMQYSSVGNEAHGGIGNDSLSGTNGNQALYGEDGNDTIRGGNDYGTPDTDTLDGGAGDDSIISGMVDTPSNAYWQTRGDLMSGGAGQDTIIGGAADDTLSGGTGDDSMEGGDGADLFVIEDGFGNDTIVGGEGTSPGANDDTLDLSALTGPVTVTYTGDEAGTITDGTDTITFSEIENLVLTNQNDSVIAVSNGTINVDVGDGDDTVWSSYSHSSDDMIIGGGGNDDVQAGGGSDYIDGGTGNDYLNTGGGGSDTVYAGEGDDTIASWYVDGDAEIYGEDGDDVIYGSSLADTLDGGEGNDYIYGEGGADTILGQAGNDSLDGWNDAETIDGGTGDDAIDGNRGDDRLTGGDGNDTFFYSVGDGHDTITDFNTGNTGTLSDGEDDNNDYIDLTGFYDNLQELYADQADDGVLNQSNVLDAKGRAVDYSDNDQFGVGSIEIQGASADSSSFTSENTGVVCFTAGTAIRTPRGDILIDDLRVGDLVSTMDNGLQRICWIGRRDVDNAALRAQVKLRPVLIPKGVLGAERNLFVSRQHALLSGSDHFARAIHLSKTTRGIRIANGKRNVTYIHLMFDKHEVIFAENVASESFYPGPMALEMFDPAMSHSFFETFPELQRTCVSNLDTSNIFGAPARNFLALKEVRQVACE